MNVNLTKSGTITEQNVSNSIESISKSIELDEKTNNCFLNFKKEEEINSFSKVSQNEQDNSAKETISTTKQSSIDQKIESISSELREIDTLAKHLQKLVLESSKKDDFQFIELQVDNLKKRLVGLKSNIRLVTIRVNINSDSEFSQDVISKLCSFGNEIYLNLYKIKSHSQKMKLSLANKQIEEQLLLCKDYFKEFTTRLNDIVRNLRYSKIKDTPQNSDSNDDSILDYSPEKTDFYLFDLYIICSISKNFNKLSPIFIKLIKKIEEVREKLKVDMQNVFNDFSDLQQGKEKYKVMSLPFATFLQDKNDFESSVKESREKKYEKKLVQFKKAISSLLIYNVELSKFTREITKYTVKMMVSEYDMIRNQYDIAKKTIIMNKAGMSKERVFQILNPIKQEVALFLKRYDELGNLFAKFHYTEFIDQNEASKILKKVPEDAKEEIRAQIESLNNPNDPLKTLPEHKKLYRELLLRASRLNSEGFTISGFYAAKLNF